MTRVAQRITIEQPVRAVYDTWTRFEEFPRFMESVERVEQLDDTHLRWHVDIAGERATFDAEITEQVPDTRIAWRATSGPEHAGVVDFHRLDDAVTEVDVAMDVDLDGLEKQAPAPAGRLEQVLADDLGRFKRLLETDGAAASGWRGEVRPRASGERMTTVDKIANSIVTVGALNWGLVALARLDVVGRLLGRGAFGRTSLASRLAYGLVGAAGAYTLARLAIKKTQT